MNSRRSVALAFAAVLLVGVAPLGGASATPEPKPDLKAAKQLLPGAQQGRKALESMSSEDEATAAERNGRSLANFRDLLSHDDTVWVSSKGRIFYADRADASQMATAEQQSAPQSAAWVTFPESQTFQLHSKPGSSHTAFLDFDGYTLPSTAAWNDPMVDGVHTNAVIPAGTYGGFSLDGSASFTSDEKAFIQAVWRIVAEKYAAFDVDVTTEQPSSDALNRTSAGDSTYGTRVVITNDMAARGGVCTASSGSGCIGIAWIDVFDAEQDDGWGTDGFEPAWVYTKFTAADPVFSAGSVANTAAHELGHTLGLDHDRTAGTSYYGGHDDWFPIMGASNRAVGHFTNGSSYLGEVTDQVDPDTQAHNADDLDVIGKAGAPLRTDDVVGTKALGEAESYSQDGIIGRNGNSTTRDTDTFSVSRNCTNTLTATASGIGLGQAVDLKVTVRNPSNVVAATANPATTGDTSTIPNTPVNMDAAASIAGAGPGLWTVTVEGVGLGNPLTTGYTDYGSIGMYHLDISGCPVLASAPPAPSASSGDVSAFVSWLDPSTLGGGTFLRWEVLDATNNNVVCTQTTQSSKFCTVPNLTNGTAYSFKVRAVTSVGDGALSPASNSVKPFAPVAGAFVPLSPFRVLDTRPTGGGITNVGPQATPVGKDGTLVLRVAGSGGVPSSGAGAVVLNVTVAGTGTGGYVTVFPAGGSPPTASNLNFVGGQTLANHVTVKLNASGDVAFFNRSDKPVDLIADVAGWYRDGTGSLAGTFNAMAPKRLLQTFNPNFVSHLGQIPGNGTVDFQVGSASGTTIPPDAAAGVLNLTVTNTGSAGYVSAYPADQATPPLVSNLNYGAGQTIANAATVKLGGNPGKVRLYVDKNSQPIDLIADIAGWFVPGTPAVTGAYTPVTPKRILDTRTGANATKVKALSSINLTVTGPSSGVPAGQAAAAVLNLTVTDATTGGYLTVYPADANLPLASNVNFLAGQTIPNLATVKLSPTGQITLYNGSPQSIDVIVDVAGWYKN